MRSPQDGLEAVKVHTAHGGSDGLDVGGVVDVGEFGVECVGLELKIGSDGGVEGLEVGIEACVTLVGPGVKAVHVVNQIVNLFYVFETTSMTK